MQTDQHTTTHRPRGRWGRWTERTGAQRRAHLLAFLGATALLAAACATPEEPGDDPPSSELREERDELRAQLDAAEAELLEAERELERLEERLDRRETEAQDEDEAPEPGSDAPARQRTPEGLIDQPRASIDPEDLPEGFEPGTTPWESYEPPQPVNGAFEHPGDVAFEIAEAIGGANLGGPDGAWETTVRVLLDEDDPDLATAAVLRWGFLDDAVAGEDVRVTLVREGDGWRAGEVERRLHCQRGVTDDGRCS